MIFAGWDPKSLLDAKHFPINRLNLRYERLFPFGKPDEFFQRGARNISQHVVIVTSKIDNANPSCALRLDLIRLGHGSDNAAGHY